VALVTGGYAPSCRSHFLCSRRISFSRQEVAIGSERKTSGACIGLRDAAKKYTLSTNLIQL